MEDLIRQADPDGLVEHWEHAPNWDGYVGLSKDGKPVRGAAISGMAVSQARSLDRANVRAHGPLVEYP